MRIALPFAAMLLIGVPGCTSQVPEQRTVMSTEGTTLVQSAQVTNLRDVAVHGGQPSGAGAFIGAILGSIAGSKIGSGSGSMAASIGGTFAGGMAGNQMEQAALGTSAMEVTVRMENGESRTYLIQPDADLRTGDMVKVITRGGITRISR